MLSQIQRLKWRQIKSSLLSIDQSQKVFTKCKPFWALWTSTAGSYRASHISLHLSQKSLRALMWSLKRSWSHKEQTSCLWRLRLSLDFWCWLSSLLHFCNISTLCYQYILKLMHLSTLFQIFSHRSTLMDDELQSTSHRRWYLQSESMKLIMRSYS